MKECTCIDNTRTPVVGDVIIQCRKCEGFRTYPKYTVNERVPDWISLEKKTIRKGTRIRILDHNFVIASVERRSRGVARIHMTCSPGCCTQPFDNHMTVSSRFLFEMKRAGIIKEII